MQFSEFVIYLLPKFSLHQISHSPINSAKKGNTELKVDSTTPPHRTVNICSPRLAWVRWGNFYYIFPPYSIPGQSTLYYTLGFKFKISYHKFIPGFHWSITFPLPLDYKVPTSTHHNTPPERVNVLSKSKTIYLLVAHCLHGHSTVISVILLWSHIQVPVSIKSSLTWLETFIIKRASTEVFLALLWLCGWTHGSVILPLVVSYIWIGSQPVGPLFMLVIHIGIPSSTHTTWVLLAAHSWIVSSVVSSATPVLWTSILGIMYCGHTGNNFRTNFAQV